MTIQELEQAIREYIMDIYNRKYIGKLNIQKLDPVGYSVKFGMDTPLQPITIYAELEDNEFLKFIKQEIKSRRFNLLFYGELKLEYPYDCTPINSECKCHDKGRIN